jgi:hypothetical protein
MVLRLLLVPTSPVIAFVDVPSITKSIVNHVQTSLARQAHNLDDLGAYQAAALSVRDNLIVCVISIDYFLYLERPLRSTGIRPSWNTLEKLPNALTIFRSSFLWVVHWITRF